MSVFEINPSKTEISKMIELKFILGATETLEFIYQEFTS